MRSIALGLLFLLFVNLEDASAEQSTTVVSQASPEVAVSGVVLMSIQPVDDAYVGYPYLDKGLGGIAPGFAIGMGMTYRRFVASAELSSAGLSVSQQGRLVGSRAEGRLRDSLFNVLAGVAVASDNLPARIQLLAGLSRIFRGPTLNGRPVSQADGDALDPAIAEGAGTLGFTSGIDATRAVTSHVAILGSFRYSHLPRSRRATEIGVGSGVFRAGIGLRARLGH